MTAPTLFAALLLAQVPTAAVQGTVRDSETGTPVQGATIELLDGSRQAITDDAGYYIIEAAPTGPRHLKVSGLGYRSRTLHVFVPADGAIQVDVALLPEPIPLQPVEASVDVPYPARRAIADGDLVRRVGSRTMTHDDIRTHPGLAEPDFFEALGGSSVRIDPESPNGLHVRGGAGDQNLFTLDGIPVFSPYHATGQFSAVDPDAISRVDLHGGVPPVALGDALSGIIELRTRRPGTDRFAFRGAVTPARLRLTADGPVAFGAGLLLSGGWGQPGFLAPSGEDSYVRGLFKHGLAKLERPLADGHLQLLGFQSDNTLQTTSVPTETDEPASPDAQAEVLDADDVASSNRFDWYSSSYGVAWEKAVAANALLDAQLWYADLNVAVDWRAAGNPFSASSRRRNLGSRLRLRLDGQATRSLIGVSLERERTAYAVRPLGSTDTSNSTGSFELRAEPTVFAAFAEHQRVLSRGFEVLIGLRGSRATADRLRLAPRASLRWTPSPSFSVSAGYARTYQLVQSLRNTESLIENLLSPDLPTSVGADGVPVAKADQFTVAIESQLALGVRVGLEAFARGQSGLVLVAPSTGHPFAVEEFSVGSAEILGVGVDVEMKRARYRALASYGFASVDNEALVIGEYRPGFAIRHSITTAVTYYPAAQLELRSSLRADIGRPTTFMEGPFVWEACSILEGGCEAEGSPQRTSGPLGGDRLPPYVRLDLGVRKHWHSRIFGRDGVIAAFATLSNLLGKRNVLGYVSDSDTGELSRLPMRPFSPLTAGLEWQF